MGLERASHSGYNLTRYTLARRGYTARFFSRVRGARTFARSWELTVHPGDFSIDKHDLYIFVASAYWPNEALVIVPINVQ
jgi:hypothetical protein